MSHFVYFLPSRTGLFSIQLFSAYHVHTQCLILMLRMNVKNIYKEVWYDSISVNGIDSASVVKEMIDVRDRSVKCEIFNIDDVEFIINDLCIN